MKVIYVAKKLNSAKEKCVICLGIFDGLHLGHQQVIRQARQEALKHNLALNVLTFDPHPLNILNPNKPLKMLTTAKQRQILFKNLGIKNLFVVYFNKCFSNLSPQQFVKEILLKIKPKIVVVGNDFRFGKNAKGNLKLLAHFASENNFGLKVVPTLKIRGEKISSSLIRSLLESGYIKQANKLLGRPYELEGRVINGMKLGTKIGIPTANIKYLPGVLLPLGIFSGFFSLADKKFPAVIFIGFKLTLGLKSKTPSIEVHILNFKKNIYKKYVRIFLVNKIRDEREFKTLRELKRAIGQDIKKASNLTLHK
jgi:riboflavin kinase/FMN adenylyltransferase